MIPWKVLEPAGTVANGSSVTPLTSVRKEEHRQVESRAGVRHRKIEGCRGLAALVSGRPMTSRPSSKSAVRSNSSRSARSAASRIRRERSDAEGPSAFAAPLEALKRTVD